MRTLRSRFPSILGGGLLGLVLAGVLFAGTPAEADPAAADLRRTTLAITYPEGTSTRVDVLSPARPGVRGEADVKRQKGRTRVRLHMEPLPHPQSLGSFYTTYLLWAVAPEGQAGSLAELPHSKTFDVEVTTPFQTFGLVVTAEPHSAVALPSLMLVAENVARKDTTGTFQTGAVSYSGAIGALYQPADASDASRRDYGTPLLVLGARRAVDLARDAGADTHAAKELQQAEVRLTTLERAWPRSRSLPKDLESVAREVMRLAEHARIVTEERRERSRFAAERRAASVQVARAENEAGRAREDAQQARARADREQERATEARLDAERARVNEERARALEEAARAEAERARQAAQEAERSRAEVQQQLFQSLNTILETRREARGLIVNLSDVLFDFDRTSLTPGARERLAKLAGVLLAYPGDYRLDVEGHTDSIGSAQYNLALSVGRAESVRSYLMLSGIPAGRAGSAIGFGEDRPVASNDNDAGRQMNRRVEIVISGLDN